MRLEDLKWSIQQRIKFIDTHLFWEEKISRKDLTGFYDISIPQATKDLKQYAELAPENMYYDNSEKHYVTSLNFKPLFGPHDSENYFSKLLTGEIKGEKGQFYFSSLPPFYKLPCPGRKVDPNTLKTILKSINENLAIEIEYQSMNNPDPSWRWISPHAIGFDGFRWHARALCHNSKMYKDFNLGRILAIKGQQSFELDHSNDFLWHNNITFKIGPHPDLSEGQRKCIIRDYMMIEGETCFEVKASFIFYIKRRLGLEEGHEKKPGKHQHIILLNADEVHSKVEVLESIASTKLKGVFQDES
ncbi:MAG: WYL domain-containing protein [Flavobacteriaceae bacterium]|nr:MAG: WYL domain-containing protein [Flavobacteriaceae bacterium]